MVWQKVRWALKVLPPKSPCNLTTPEIIKGHIPILIRKQYNLTNPKLNCTDVEPEVDRG